MSRLCHQLIAILAVIFLTACTIQLTPNYDKELVDGLDGANEKALTLMASLSGGSSQSDYAQYKERYSSIIGQFSALKQKAETRQIPPLSKRLEKVGFVSDLCPDTTSCINDSPRSIERVIENLRTLQSTHMKTGVSADLIEGFERSHEIAIQQALFVERALER